MFRYSYCDSRCSAAGEPTRRHERALPHRRVPVALCGRPRPRAGPRLGLGSLFRERRRLAGPAGLGSRLGRVLRGGIGRRGPSGGRGLFGVQLEFEVDVHEVRFAVRALLGGVRGLSLRRGGALARVRRLVETRFLVGVRGSVPRAREKSLARRRDFDELARRGRRPGRVREQPCAPQTGFGAPRPLRVDELPQKLLLAGPALRPRLAPVEGDLVEVGRVALVLEVGQRPRDGARESVRGFARRLVEGRLLLERGRHAHAEAVLGGLLLAAHVDGALPSSALTSPGGPACPSPSCSPRRARPASWPAPL